MDIIKISIINDEAILKFNGDIKVEHETKIEIRKKFDEIIDLLEKDEVFKKSLGFKEVQ